MTTQQNDDRRYETFEMRAAYDPRYVVDSRNITSKAACKAAYAEAERIYGEMGKIRREGKAAERGSAAYDKAVAAFAQCAERRQEIFTAIRKWEER